MPEEFELIEELGKGAYGFVYKAFDHVTKQNVALKIIDLTEEELRILGNEAEIL